MISLSSVEKTEQDCKKLQNRYLSDKREMSKTGNYCIE